MEQERRVHIITAGESIHEIFPTSSKYISYATKLYVIVEEDIFKDTDDEQKQKTRVAIRSSIEKLKEIAGPFVEDGIEVIPIIDDTLDYIRDAVVSIYEKDKIAKYYFNVSSGTTGLSIGLFMMAMWIKAIPYHIGKKGDPRFIPIPQVHMGNFKKNPNRVKILEILDKSNGKHLSRKQLKGLLDKEYIPINDSGKEKRSLSYGGFTSLIESLIEWKLVGKRSFGDSSRDIEYYLTDDGAFTLRFMKI
ncbi:hypothetical protein [Methanolobus bombayensis]|uniref:hypothetical protein n=1 Tax=Methanolobus bombayensis TaxID=38023 RepID=UPI001AE96787|nr:hypothetical protein [Methanolobus bombayensis]MBP1908319.1 hypothetical protein [Methanolobus bombayensis]